MKPRHERALQILQLYIDGVRVVEIADRFKIHRSTVYQDRNLALRLCKIVLVKRLSVRSPAGVTSDWIALPVDDDT